MDPNGTVPDLGDLLQQSGITGDLMWGSPLSWTTTINLGDLNDAITPAANQNVNKRPGYTVNTTPVSPATSGNSGNNTNIASGSVAATAGAAGIVDTANPNTDITATPTTSTVTAILPVESRTDTVTNETMQRTLRNLKRESDSGQSNSVDLSPAKVQKLCMKANELDSQNIFQYSVITDMTIHEKATHTLRDGRTKTSELKREIDVVVEPIPPVISHYLSEMRLKEQSWRHPNAQATVIELRTTIHLQQKD